MNDRLTPLLSTRNASLADLGELLRAQHAAQLDVVTAAGGLTAVDGQLLLRGAGEPQLSETGVSATDIALVTDGPRRCGHRRQARHPDQIPAPAAG